MARIIDKNLQTLDSAIVGRRVLINDREQNEILSAYRTTIQRL